ncbi:unnamed protein product [Rhizoctonia solani]|uniref:Transmembrane protein n=1 Tax=Rhizoctonia solani TaxID=456999 RepID=A0A8H3CV77_9AGAM|nr:unnamed protein product [Rhizoctonia solani]
MVLWKSLLFSARPSLPSLYHSQRLFESEMSLPPWDQLTFTFGWDTETQTLRQCSTLRVNYDTEIAPGAVANPPPTPPYTLVVYAGGYRPFTLAIANTARNGTYPWLLNLPLGPRYIVGMTDSRGYTGGSSLVFAMTAGNESCILEPSPIVPASLSFTRTGAAQCGQVNYVMHNGTSPYQVEILPENHQRKTLYFATNKFGFTLDLTTGLNVYVAITDAAGNSGVDDLITVGTSVDNSCLRAAATVSVGRASAMYTGSGISMPSASPTSTSATITITGTGRPFSGSNQSTGVSKAPIIAGVVAGIVGIAFIIFLAICIYHRRRRRAAAQAQPTMTQQQVNLPQNPHTYFGPLPVSQYPSVTQYPSAAVPQIQTPEPQIYAPVPYSTNQFMPIPSSAYTHLSAVPTHAPHMQGYQSGQTLLLDGTPSPDQSPYATSRFSQGTFTGSGGTSGLSSYTGTTEGQQRMASPSLPPGALPPHSNLGLTEQAWASQNTGNPLVRPFVGSPRSETASTLPPYGPADGKSHTPGPEK